MCNDSLDITIATGSQRSQISLYFGMGHTFDARNIEIKAFYMLNVAHVKNDVK